MPPPHIRLQSTLQQIASANGEGSPFSGCAGPGATRQGCRGAEGESIIAKPINRDTFPGRSGFWARESLITRSEYLGHPDARITLQFYCHNEIAQPDLFDNIEEVAS